MREFELFNDQAQGTRIKREKGIDHSQLYLEQHRWSDQIEEEQ